MTYTLRVHSEADAEHARTIAWLTEHVSAAHAIAHATAIATALDQILERPLAWPQWKSRPNIRVRHLRDIPYSIVYQVRDRVVTVAAFTHMHRAPGYWLERVK